LEWVLLFQTLLPSTRDWYKSAPFDLPGKFRVADASIGLQNTQNKFIQRIQQMRRDLFGHI
jgi:hypothetical protein